MDVNFCLIEMLIKIIFGLSLILSINGSFFHESAVIKKRFTKRGNAPDYSECGTQGKPDELFYLIQTLEIATKNREPGPKRRKKKEAIDTDNPIRNPKITHGVATRPNEFPWQVAIMEDNNRFTCGASIIRPLYVLTAAHCVFDKGLKKLISAHRIYLRLGVWTLLSSAEDNYSIARVLKIIIHPNYDSTYLENDIAVLKLTQAIEFKDSIRPVCLPREDMVIEHRKATVTGWGRKETGSHADRLQKVTSSVITNEECYHKYKNLIKPTVMCMDSQSGDACIGDSGGPSVMRDPENSGRYAIIGIVSHGTDKNNCKHDGKPGVYTRVVKFKTWLQHQMT